MDEIKAKKSCSKYLTWTGSDLFSLPARTGDRAVTTEEERKLNSKLTTISPQEMLYIIIFFFKESCK